MRDKHIIFAILIITLIFLISCNKKAETNNETTEKNVSQEKPKELPKEVPKQQITKIKPEDLPWDDCAKPFEKQELLEICNLDFASAKYYETSKSCQINLLSKKITHEKVFIEIETHENKEKAKNKYESIIKSEGKKNNASFSGATAQWQELVTGKTSEGTESQGLLRERIEMYKGKKEVEINVVPAKGCKDLQKLVQKIFALI